MRSFNLDKQTKFPLVISLHGGGDSGTDNVRNLVVETEILASVENRELYPCFVLAPQAAEGSWWSFPNALRPRMTKALIASYPQSYHRIQGFNLERDKARAPLETVPYGFGEMEEVVHLFEKLCRELPFDEDRIYIVGQSMGGIGIWNALHEHPHLFAGAVTSASLMEPWLEPKKFSNVPIWIFHGKGDQSVPYECSVHAFERLKEENANVKFTALGNEGHGPKTRYTAPV